MQYSGQYLQISAYMIPKFIFRYNDWKSSFSTEINSEFFFLNFNLLKRNEKNFFFFYFCLTFHEAKKDKFVLFFLNITTYYWISDKKYQLKIFERNVRIFSSHFISIKYIKVSFAFSWRGVIFNITVTSINIQTFNNSQVEHIYLWVIFLSLQII